MALIDEKVRTVTTFVLEDFLLTVISRKTLNFLIYQDPLTLSPLLQILSQQLRQTTKLLEE
jgi:CRP-like cAMP-binding protein